jgi:sugar transferase EpsL
MGASAGRALRLNRRSMPRLSFKTNNHIRLLMSAFVKRVADILLSGIALLVLAPLMAVVALAIPASSDGPALFRQTRTGHKGKSFTLLKFRTMNTGRNRDGTLLPDAKRLTPIGRWLRNWSVDELPQLWNVLRGEMSLVGPRPLLMQYLHQYTPEEYHRHDVKPGITGWAQINGRNLITWEQKFALDLWYVDHQCLLLDLRILLRTLWQALAQRGISFDGCATMPKLSRSQDQKSSGPSK